ncbi:MAG: DUF4861 family protein [Tepidisphaeraceae bacterium]
MRSWHSIVICLAVGVCVTVWAAPHDGAGRSSTTPATTAATRATVRIVPERKDDVAWENDRVAFRIYGPPLRDGMEASGIDVWTKRTADLVIDRWYADDLAGVRSYHKDHGQGYDGFEVGDSAGCGGAGVWVNDGFIVPDVYDRVSIVATGGDVVEFVVMYSYPPVNGRPLFETRRIRLPVGARFNDITSTFSYDREGHEPASNLDVGIGLMAQTAEAQFDCDPATGAMTVWDHLPGREALGLAALAAPGGRMVRVPHPKSPHAEQAVYVTKTDAAGQIAYRAGFGWSGDGSARTLDEWKAKATRPAVR